MKDSPQRFPGSLEVVLLNIGLDDSQALDDQGPTFDEGLRVKVVPGTKKMLLFKYNSNKRKQK